MTEHCLTAQFLAKEIEKRTIDHIKHPMGTESIVKSLIKTLKSMHPNEKNLIEISENWIKVLDQDIPPGPLFDANEECVFITNVFEYMFTRKIKDDDAFVYINHVHRLSELKILANAIESDALIDLTRCVHSLPVAQGKDNVASALKLAVTVTKINTRDAFGITIDEFKKRANKSILSELLPSNITDPISEHRIMHLIHLALHEE